MPTPAPYLTALRCMRCGRTYPADSPAFTCDCRPNVGSDVGTLDVALGLHRDST